MARDDDDALNPAQQSIASTIKAIQQSLKSTRGKIRKSTLGAERDDGSPVKSPDFKVGTGPALRATALGIKQLEDLGVKPLGKGDRRGRTDFDTEASDFLESLQFQRGGLEREHNLTANALAPRSKLQRDAIKTNQAIFSGRKLRQSAQTSRIPRGAGLLLGADRRLV